MKQYYIIYPGKPQEGPFDEQFVREQYAAGAYQKNAHVWTEGMKEWLPIDSVLGFKTESISLPPPIPPCKLVAPTPPIPPQQPQPPPPAPELTFQEDNAEKSTAMSSVNRLQMGAVTGGVIGFVVGLVACIFITNDILDSMSESERGQVGLSKVALIILIGTLFSVLSCAFSGATAGLFLSEENPLRKAAGIGLLAGFVIAMLTRVSFSIEIEVIFILGLYTCIFGTLSGLLTGYRLKR